MPDISAIQNTPDVSFIDNKTIDDVRGDMVADIDADFTQTRLKFHGAKRKQKEIPY